MSREIEKFSRNQGLAFLGDIPFDPVFTQAMVQAQTVFEYDKDSKGGQAVRKIWEELAKKLEL